MLFKCPVSSTIIINDKYPTAVVCTQGGRGGCNPSSIGPIVRKHTLKCPLWRQKEIPVVELYIICYHYIVKLITGDFHSFHVCSYVKPCEL